MADEQSDDFTDSVDMEPVEDAGEATDSGTTSEEDSDAQSEIDVEEDSIDEAGDAETTETSADPLQTALEGYDLIYVNGKLSPDMAAALEGAVSSNTLPCIINNARDGVANSLSENMRADFVKADTEDADGHYVNKYVYFFKNMLNESVNEQELLNKDFNKTFTDTQSEGFEEISSYIASENKYRELDKDESGKAVEKLSSDLSFARAIEYILNYKYKRIETVKSDISVLAIEPDKITNNKELKEETLDICRQHSAIIGKDVYLIKGEEKELVRCLDMNQEGNLVVRTKDNIIKEIMSGEVSIRGVKGYV